jgi:hypothetical protein
MKLRLDLVLCAILIATAGSELVAPDALSAERTDQVCQTGDGRAAGATRLEAKERILAEGYSDVSLLARGCDDVWHALAFAEGDPVNLQVTPQGQVLTE